MLRSISIVICTKDRAASLARSLGALARIAKPRGIDMELILVDNGSTDTTAETFERLRYRLPFPADYIFEPAPGIGHAMDSGYRRSRGEIVAFTDDDCYPASDFAQAIAAAFADPTIGVASGRILLHDPDDLPITIEESRVPQHFPGGSYVRAGQFAGANLSFRRTALDTVGGFDPLFGPGSYIGSAADIDAAGRVCLAGWDGVYDPRIVVSHHHGRKEQHRAGIVRRYAIGSGGYHMKLLLQERRGGIFLRYVAGLLRRMMRSPSSVRWELEGAWRYARYRVRRPAATRPSGRAKAAGGVLSRTD